MNGAGLLKILAVCHRTAQAMHTRVNKQVGKLHVGGDNLLYRHVLGDSHCCTPLINLGLLYPVSRSFATTILR